MLMNKCTTVYNSPDVLFSEIPNILTQFMLSKYFLSSMLFCTRVTKWLWILTSFTEVGGWDFYILIETRIANCFCLIFNFAGKNNNSYNGQGSSQVLQKLFCLNIQVIIRTRGIYTLVISIWFAGVFMNKKYVLKNDQHLLSWFVNWLTLQIA